MITCFSPQLNFDTDQEDESEESGSRKLSGTLRTKKVTEFFSQYVFFLHKFGETLAYHFLFREGAKYIKDLFKLSQVAAQKTKGFHLSTVFQ